MHNNLFHDFYFLWSSVRWRFGQLTYQGTCLSVPLFPFFSLPATSYSHSYFFSSQFLAKFLYWDIFSLSLHKGKRNNVLLHQLCWARWWGYFRVVRQLIVCVRLGKGWYFYNWCRDYVQWCPPGMIRVGWWWSGVCFSHERYWMQKNRKLK